MEIIKNIAAVVGLIVSLATLITLFTKGGRKFWKTLVTKGTKDIQAENAKQTQDIEEIKKMVQHLIVNNEALEEVAKQQCRDMIRNTYYKYCDTKKIPMYERKAVEQAYQIYTSRFNGNSYATLLYNEITKWEILPNEHRIEA